MYRLDEEIDVMYGTLDVSILNTGGIDHTLVYTYHMYIYSLLYTNGYTHILFDKIVYNLCIF